MAIVFVVFFLFKAKRKVAFSILIGSAILGMIIFLFGERVLDVLFAMNPEFRESWRYVFEIAFEIFIHRGEVGSVTAVANMPIPPLSVETLLGTGLVRTAGANVTGSDSGYVQSYYALGLVMAAFFYLSLARVFLAYLGRIPEKLLYGMLVAAMFLIEAKEPFIFKYIVPFFCVCALSMMAPAAKPGSGRESLAHET
jgi:hypothetical protein